MPCVATTRTLLSGHIPSRRPYICTHEDPTPTSESQTPKMASISASSRTHATRVGTPASTRYPRLVWQDAQLRIYHAASPSSGCRYTADIDSSSDCQYERSYEIVRRTRRRPCASGFGLVDPSSASIRCASSTARFIVVLRSPFLNDAARGPPRAFFLTVQFPTAACSSLAHAHYLKAAQLAKRHLTPIFSSVCAPGL